LAFDDDEIENVVVRLLTARKKTLALAESCTGGNIAHRITNVPGASEVFLGGVVSYANSAKEKFLGVPRKPLRHTRRGERSRWRAKWRRRAGKIRFRFCAGVTGIAGPGGGTADKPVGTVFIALATAAGVR
jgi:nicotinamide-nucleotide amidase